MVRLQRREHRRHRHECGDENTQGNSRHQRHRKAVAKVLRDVVKRQAGERHPDAAEPANHLHPAHFLRHDPPENVRKDSGEEEGRPHLEPLRGGKAQLINEHHRHNHRKTKQRQGVNNAHNAREQDAAVGIEQRRGAPQFGEFFASGQVLHMARRFGMTHRHQRNDAAGGAKDQRQPQGAHFANVGNGEARNIAAEHADAHGVDRPEPAQRRAGTVAANVVDNGDDK
ncbi:hypothetical protein SB00610_03553 [Klebsiella quasipneumoniae subsp. similipneumoniae]|nr:hypothetical protein SB00610_03553 [Klebsiella quasipneumoniae subsp. similipneumoniae]